MRAPVNPPPHTGIPLAFNLDDHSGGANMSIGPLSQYLQSQAQNAAKSSASANKSAPVENQDPTDPAGIIAEIANGGSAGLLKYQEQQIAKKARQDELNALGLTEKQLASLSPQQQQAVQDAIKKAIEAAIRKQLGGDSQGGDASTQAGVSSANGLVSSSTLASLLSLQ